MRSVTKMMNVVLVLSVFGWVVGCGGGDDNNNPPACQDSDKDGHDAVNATQCPEGDDCDDNNAAVYKGATENCSDGVDNDCNGFADKDDPACKPCTAENDKDGDGVCPPADCCNSGTETSLGCTTATAASIKPGATEKDGDKVDSNCDGCDEQTCYECPKDALDGINDYMDDLAKHPGCSAEPSDMRTLDYAPAVIPGFKCVAKEYPFPEGVTENKAKPIVLLVHGNSDMPNVWEVCKIGPAATTVCNHYNDMVSEKLAAQGYKTYAVDLRFDRTCKKDGGAGPAGVDPCNNNDTENLARNMDHGWGVPIVQNLIRSVIEANPGRKVSLVAHSYGVTVTRDALRRLQCKEKFNPWPHIQEIVLAAGASHGVSTYDLGYCEKNPTMRGTVTCEMGSRMNFKPTDFSRPLNGPSGAYETPCGDGQTAFGVKNLCQGSIPYTTIVMEDQKDGTFKDEFVSQGSSGLKGATNLTITLDDVDTTGYFYSFKDKDGNVRSYFWSHFGAARSAAAVNEINAKLTR